MEKQRLFVDMDGTLAFFRNIDSLELLYEKGYYRNLEPMSNVVEAVKEIIENHQEVEVFILSAVLSDSRYAMQEKIEWLNEYLPEVDQEHCIFPPCGVDKKEYVPGGIRETDAVLDDYTTNLISWEPSGLGIKILNGINHTKGLWAGNRLDYSKNGKKLTKNIIQIMQLRCYNKIVTPTLNKMI